MRHLPLLLLLAACGSPSFETDSGQLRISDDNVVDLVAEDGGPSPFLAGTELCPEVSPDAGSRPEGEYNPMDCFAQSFAGPATGDGECLDFDAPGTVDWTFTAQTCDGNTFGYVPTDDHVAIDVLAATDVEGELPMRLEEAAEENADDGARLDAPADWMLAEGEPWRIVSGEPFDLAPRLRTVGEGTPVAWSNGALSTSAAANITAQSTAGVFRLLVGPDTETPLTLSAGGADFPVGTVIGVGAGAVASIELAVLTLENVEEGLSAPYAARAVLRNGAGELVFGAPVKWRFAPQLVIQGPDGGGTLPGADYVRFVDMCQDPATTFGEQRGTLTATVGMLSASKELTWTPRLAAAPAEGWAPHEDCQTACGCASEAGAPASFALAGLAALALARRRPSTRVPPSRSE